MSDSVYLAKLITLSNKLHLQAFVCYKDEDIREVIKTLTDMDIKIIAVLGLLNKHPDQLTEECLASLRLAFKMRFKLDQRLFELLDNKNLSL